MNIQLSIIIPHFNSGYLLNKLLASIISECGKDTQIIVVDDNSTKSLDDYNACKEIYKDRVEFYTNNLSSNSAGTCRNIGIDNAMGKWLMFCDSDDYLLPGWYEKVSKHFDNAEDVVFFLPTAVKFQTGVASNRADAYRRLLSDYMNKKVGAKIRLKTKFVIPYSKLIKAEIVNRNNIRFDSIQYGNDVMFSVKLGLSIDSFTVSKDEIYCITEGSNSLTTKRTEKSFRVRTEVIAKRYKYVKGRISYYEWLQTGIGLAPLSTVFRAMRCGFGFNLVRSIIVLFHEYGIPILSLDSFMYQLLCPHLDALNMMRKYDNEEKI